MKIQPTKTYKGIRWQALFFFHISWLCHAVSGELQYSILEEMRKGSLVGNIANDLGLNIKELSSRNFQIVSHISEKYFTTSLENGNLYIRDRIDRETLCGASDKCFLTFDALLENPLNVFHVKIEIQDINDNAPKFFHETIKLEISEFTSLGARFVLQNARDSDLGINSVQSYSLNINEYFSLGEKKNPDGIILPEMVLEKSLDRETQSSYELTLSAFDGGRPPKTGTALIKICVIDVNDNFPIFSQDVYKVNLKENEPVNTTVLQLKASDKDEGSNALIFYSFSNIQEDALKVFTIDSNNGEIKINNNVDFEKTNTYEMLVQAQDGGGLASHANVVIQITDVNDNVPEITVNSIATTIPEDTLPGTVVALINVYDKDNGENGDVICQIIETSAFKLLSSSGNYYKIVTAYAMDRENISYYDITVMATDKGSPPLSSTKIIRIDISDVNDNPPIFEKTTYVAYVQENNLKGASIYKMHASDLDAEENAKVVYSISSLKMKELPVSLYLSINPVTGVIYAQQSFDYEQHKEFYIEVMAKDNGSPSLSSNATLKICVADQNDNAPLILYPSPETEGSTLFEMVPLAFEQGYLVTKVVAVDSDSGHNAWLSYHFLQVSDSSYFSIAQNNGEIRTSRSFQEKDALRQKVVVMVKDNGNPSLSATVTLHFVVAHNFQQALPELNNQPRDVGSQTNLQLYLVIALALISFLFMLTVILAVVSKYRKLKPATAVNSMNTNIYSQVDPRLFSRYSNGTLPLPFSYDVCVSLDSNQSDFSFLKPNQNVPVANLIDSETSGTGVENAKEIVPTSNHLESLSSKEDIKEVLKEVRGLFGELRKEISPTTLQKRRDLRFITDSLRSAGIQYCWGFPVSIITSKNGETVTYRTPEDLHKINEKWGLKITPPELDTEPTDPPQQDPRETTQHCSHPSE
ncbi:protocadherin gamma-B2-like [Bombina bombina]|uniref:protocadherin gamma-B2-like n=1 Tax=Bombina bombina TaxID=8345 RepID=UPI00235ABBE3|nr:protocadherin gamma-B2-like [Bombina bombina]